MKKLFILIAILYALVSSGAAYASEYVVKSGDCLSMIGKKFNLSYLKIAKLNKIENPDLIYPGQIIVIASEINEIENTGLVNQKSIITRPTQKLENASEIIYGAHKILREHGISIENIPDRIYIYRDGDIGTHKYQHGLEKAKIHLGYSSNLTGKYLGHNTIYPGDYILMTSGYKTVRLYLVGLSEPMDVLEYSINNSANQKIDSAYWIGACFNWARIIQRKEIPEEPIEEVTIPKLPILEPAPPVEPIIPPTITTTEIQKPDVCKGTGCPMEIERNLGTSFWVHDPDSHQAKTFGHNFYGEMLLWKNFKKDCSSEYWYGLGVYGSYYDYDSAHQPTGGDGNRLAGQIGIRRFYKNYYCMNRQLQLKYRFGYEKSEWGSTELHEEINQSGLVNGIYFEYIPEIIKYNLDFVFQLEAWTGFNQHVSAPKEWHVGSASRTFVSSFIGLDWKINPRTTLRFGGGPEFEGVEDSIMITPRIELQRKLPKNWGKIIVGTSAKFYLNEFGNTYISLVRYEGDALEIGYENFRLTYGGKQVGYGVGGTQLLDKEI